MVNKLRHTISEWSEVQKIFAGFAGVTLLCLFAAAISNQVLLVALPAGLLLAYVTVVDFKKIFWLLLLMLPFSIEFFLDNGLATDLPNEPLMIGLTLIYLIFALQKGKEKSSAFIRHPISLLILLHLAWILATTFTSTDIVISFKYLLAKIWYIVPFYFMAGYVIKDKKSFRRFFWIIFIPLLITVLITIFRHALLGFSFKGVNSVMKPFFRNHVNYAAILVIFIPYIWYRMKDFKRWSFKWLFLGFGILIFLIGVQLSFTRAAYVCVILSIGAYYIVKFRLMKYAVGATLIGMIAFLLHFLPNNKYQDYSPNFKKTVTHTNFNNLLDATSKGEDISTMERVYRWLAGYYMVKEHPITGFGPGCFAHYYRGYTVTSFTTYVSDNEENSGVHSYYLMTGVEQGIPGAVLFLILCFFVLIKGEQIYHETKTEAYQWMVMSALLCFISICALLMINDLLEADKVGPFFFMSLAFIVNVDVWNRRELERK